MNLSYKMCRVYGHAWDPQTVTRQGREFISHLKCLRCTTIRRWTVNYRGEIVRNNYTYAEGYLMPKGVQVDRRDLRLSLLSGR